MAPSRIEEIFVEPDGHAPPKPDASRLKVRRTKNPQPLQSPKELQFGRTFTDHMVQIGWTLAKGWDAPEIVPFQNFSISPSCCALQYGFECFEGMKAFKDECGQLRMFRPKKNFERLNKSAKRIALPTFDVDSLVQILGQFLKLEDRWIPAERGYSLYLRPTIIGTSADLGVHAPTSALFYIIASPVGAYFSKAISVQALSSSVATRAWPGGFGDCKLGANYAPTVAAQQQAAKSDCQQVLWLFGPENLVTEAGSMNFFAVLRDPLAKDRFELVTAPLEDGIILHGVTRDCVLDLAREKLPADQWTINERNFGINELVEASERGGLVEAFGSGTAAIISPIKCIRWQNRDVHCGLKGGEESGYLATLMKDWIEARQYGEVEHEWSCLVGSALIQ